MSNVETEQKVNNLKIDFVTEHQESLVSGAVDLVNYFYKDGLLLPVTVESYSKLASERKLVVATDGFGKVVATAAYTQTYPKDVWEFGGWAVAPEHQHNGLGISVLKKLLLGNKHWKTIAFGNSNSGPIFKKIGATVIEKHSVVPAEAFALCANCKNKPNVGCCDTIYNLTPVIVNWAMAGMSPRQVDRLIYGLGENAITGFTNLDENWAMK